MTSEVLATIDKRHKLVLKVITTNARVYDSLGFEKLFDPNRTSLDFYAEPGYLSAQRKASLTVAGGAFKFSANAVPTSRSPTIRNSSTAGSVS